MVPAVLLAARGIDFDETDAAIARAAAAEGEAAASAVNGAEEEAEEVEAEQAQEATRGTKGGAGAGGRGPLDSRTTLAQATVGWRGSQRNFAIIDGVHEHREACASPRPQTLQFTLTSLLPSPLSPHTARSRPTLLPVAERRRLRLLPEIQELVGKLWAVGVKGHAQRMNLQAYMNYHLSVYYFVSAIEAGLEVCALDEEIDLFEAWDTAISDWRSDVTAVAHLKSQTLHASATGFQPETFTRASGGRLSLQASSTMKTAEGRRFESHFHSSTPSVTPVSS